MLTSFETHWQSLSFPTRQMCGHLSRSLPRPRPSALELSLGRCGERQKQMVQVHNYFRLEYGRIIGPCKDIVQIDLIWKLWHRGCKTTFLQWGFASEKRETLLRDKMKQQITAGCTYTQVRNNPGKIKKIQSEKARTSVGKKLIDFGEKAKFRMMFPGYSLQLLCSYLHKHCLSLHVYTRVYIPVHSVHLPLCVHEYVWGREGGREEEM